MLRRYKPVERAAHPGVGAPCASSVRLQLHLRRRSRELPGFRHTSHVRRLGSLRCRLPSLRASTRRLFSRRRLLGPCCVTQLPQLPGVRPPGVRLPGVRPPGVRLPCVRPPGVRLPGVIAISPISPDGEDGRERLSGCVRGSGRGQPSGAGWHGGTCLVKHDRARHHHTAIVKQHAVHG